MIYSSSPINWPSFKPLAQIVVQDILLRNFKKPKFSKGHNSRKIKWLFFKNFNQVIYSSSPISWPSFKPQAQILFEISCWKDFILIFSKGRNTRKGDNSDKKKQYRSAIFPWGIHIWNFKTLACTVHKIWHASNFILIFSKGHNSRKKDKSDKKKTCISYFNMRNGIHIWNFKTLACTFLDKWMDELMDNPKPICSCNFFEDFHKQVWANCVDPDLIMVYPTCQSIFILWMHYMYYTWFKFFDNYSSCLECLNLFWIFYENIKENKTCRRTGQLAWDALFLSEAF